MIASILLSFLLFALGAFYAWRYSKTDIDPDWAMFNLAAFTGSIYGRDFADCKTPGIHLWYWLLAKLFGADVRRVRFANHFLVSVSGPIYFLMTGDFWGGLAFVVLVNSGWLLAFHGNVGQVPAALLLLALGCRDPWIAAGLALAAAAFEPKLITSLIFLSWHWPGQLFIWLLVGTLAAGALALRWPEWSAWIIESSITIPKRMAVFRKRVSYGWVPWFTASGLLYLLPWLSLAVMARRDIVYWLPVLGYFVLIGFGSVIRPNHLIPLVPWVAAAGVSTETALLLVAVDLVSGGFYFGDLWQRFYLGLRDRVQYARAAGEWLRDKPGAIWVNSLHTEIYIWACKPVNYGMAEQIEIREAAHERRAGMMQAWRCDPPDWIVEAPDPGVKIGANGYVLAYTNPLVKIYRRVYGNNGKCAS